MDNKISKKQIIEQLVIKTGKPYGYFSKWNKKSLIKLLNKTPTQIRIICNKLVGQCGKVKWDGKGVKPPFWDNNYNTFDDCKERCRPITDISGNIRKFLPDKSISYLRRAAKIQHNKGLVYHDSYLISNINPKSYRFIQKLVIDSNHGYKLYQQHFNEFVNVIQLKIGKNVDGNIINTMMTPPKLKMFILMSSNYNKPVKLQPPIQTFFIRNDLDRDTECKISFNLPITLTSLEIDVPTFNKPIIHPKLKKLILQYGQLFNKPITNKILPNLRIFYVGWECAWNMPIDNLPRKLAFFHIGGDSNFNQPLENLPKSLSVLYLSGEFNHDVNKHNLPSGVHTLLLGHSFNKSLDNLPNSIKNLMLLNNDLVHPLNSLPNSLEFLYVFSHAIIKDLPNNLDHLMLGFWFTTPDNPGVIVNLPKNLKKLTYECPEEFIKLGRTQVNIIPNNILPEKLEILNLATNMISIDDLSRLTRLKQVTVIVRKDGQNRDFIRKMKMVLDNSGVNMLIFKDCKESGRFLEKSRTMVDPSKTVYQFL